MIKKYYYDYLEDKQIQKTIIDNAIKFLKKGDYIINNNDISLNMKALKEMHDKIRHFQNVEYETNAIMIKDDIISIFFYIGHPTDYHARMFAFDKEDSVELYSMLKEILNKQKVEKCIEK